MVKSGVISLSVFFLWPSGFMRLKVGNVGKSGLKCGKVGENGEKWRKVWKSGKNW